MRASGLTSVTSVDSTMSLRLPIITTLQGVAVHEADDAHSTAYSDSLSVAFSSEAQFSFSMAASVNSPQVLSLNSTRAG